MTMPAAIELDARGRRLRAALAAVSLLTELDAFLTDHHDLWRLGGERRLAHRMDRLPARRQHGAARGR
jgi:hypothetical protein